MSRRPGHTLYRWQFVTSAARACPQALAGGGPGDSLGRVAILILPGTRRPFSSEPIIRSGTGSAAVVLQHAPVPMQPILKLLYQPFRLRRMHRAGNKFDDLTVYMSRKGGHAPLSCCCLLILRDSAPAPPIREVWDAAIELLGLDSGRAENRILVCAHRSRPSVGADSTACCRRLICSLTLDMFLLLCCTARSYRSEGESGRPYRT